jgi:predicted transcriptional regulator
MRKLASPGIDTEQPELTEVLLEAFGLPETGVEICLCVVGAGPLSAPEIGDELGYHRSTVTRYLHDLVEIGLLERSELNREGGGVVHVYHSINIERMRRETLLGFLVWAGEAAALIEEANLTKEKYLERNPDQQLPKLFWDSFSSD